MDGLEARRNLFVVAATNRPELIDPAMLRPGRLDRLLYVPLPSPADRVILTALSATVWLGPDVDLETLGRSRKAEGFSGVDLAALLREAGLDVLRRLKNNEAVEGGGTINTDENFENAFLRTQPSVSAVDGAFYVSMKDRLGNARTHSSSKRGIGAGVDRSQGDDGVHSPI
ncbi:unnamed protein product [Ascophyllum nodosum]